MESIDYLIVGHVSRDLTLTGPQLGGAVTYSGLMAHALGFRVGIVTSAPQSMQPLLQSLNRLALVCIPSDAPTSFKNVYQPEGRTQTLLSRATPLNLSHIPPGWRNAPLVHIAPIADEVDPALVNQLSDSFVTLAPQGWMRQWGADGHVSYTHWADASEFLPQVDAVSLSIEDVQHDTDTLQQFAEKTAIMSVTRGAQGCTLYLDGRPQRIATRPIDEHNPTGAGDIFAAAFFAYLYRNKHPVQAARFALHLASNSVTRAGLASIPDNKTIQRAHQWATH